MAELLDSPWLVAGVAFVLGLFAGWMTWGGPWRDQFEIGDGGDRATPGADDGPGDPALAASATPDEKMAAVLAEIHQANALLAESEEMETAMRTELDSLDQAVKRANGRLKLILKSTDRAKDPD